MRRKMEKKKNGVNSCHYVLLAMPKASAHTLVRPIIFVNQILVRVWNSSHIEHTDYKSFQEKPNVSLSAIPPGQHIEFTWAGLILTP